MAKLLVTGGAGFMGSAFVRRAVRTGDEVIVVDKLTYAADLARLAQVKGKYKFYKADICDSKKISQIFKKEQPQAIVHFAAESHVDRSIKDVCVFIDTNIKGTQVLLDTARERKIKRLIHISTDEVFGDIEKGEFDEDSPLRPNSPYAASKAAADLLVNSYIRTYNFPAIIIRPSNNYGPWQYPEKFIPRAILTAIKDKKIPVYGRGANVREWLYVEDAAQAIYQITKEGAPGQAYNLGSGFLKQNIEVAGAILKNLNKPAGEIEFVKDRPGHDIRYSLNSEKLFKEMHWSAKTDFDSGLKATIAWSLEHKAWLFSKWDEIVKLYNPGICNRISVKCL